MLVLVDATVALFCIFLAWTSMRLAERTNQFMVSIDISKSLIYWFVCAAFVGMSYYAIVRLIRRLRGRESDALHTLTLD
jgi:TRAP-type C4-dicarboxylate transport system permease small subunit